VTALNGASLEMVNHGIITGALFFLVGVIYDRTHTRSLKDFGGLLAVMPVYGYFLIVAMLASLGLPVWPGSGASSSSSLARTRWRPSSP